MLALNLSNAIPLDEPNINFYKEVIKEIDGFIFRKLIEGNKNEAFNYALEHSYKIFERNLNESVFNEALKEY